MLEFGNLTIVEKTFTREPGAVRGQAYDGLKFRRYESNKGKKAAEEEGKAFVPFKEEEFIVSNKVWLALNLEEFALVQAKKDDKVFILVVEDQAEIEPVAKFCRRSETKDGSLSKKGRKFNNEFLMNDLISVGVLDKEKLGNQYLALADVTKEITGLPSVVKSVHLVEIDKNVDETADTEETAVNGDEATKGF